MVIREMLKKIIAELKDADCDNAVFEAHRLVRHALKMSATDLVINHSQNVSKADLNLINSYVKRRVSGEPLQYILGTQEFMSLEFNVNKHVLIPRADTETLVEYVLEKYKNKGFTLLDIGTGTGCIPLSIAYYCRRGYVRGIDISTDALNTAMLNCSKLRLSERAAFSECDILSEIPGGRFDIITSNPPYIESDVIGTLQREVKDYEPHLALDGGKDGLKFYRRICDVAPTLLNSGGLLIFEIGYNQGESVRNLMKNNFDNIEIIKDLCGNDRVAAGYKKSS